MKHEAPTRNPFDFDDSRKEKASMPLNFKKVIENIRSEHDGLDKFSKVTYHKSFGFIQRYAKRKGIEGDIKAFYLEEEKFKGIEYFYEEEKFAVVAARFPFERDDAYIFVFYNDEEDIREELFSEKVFYEKSKIYQLLNDMRGNYLEEVKTSEEEKPFLKDDLEDKIQEDIRKFFDSRKFYDDNKLSYKRGLLLYGPPGNGKTSLIRTILKNIKDEAFCVLVDCKKSFEHDSESFLKSVLSDEKKIIVFEDIDALESYERSHFLNFLDGINTFENTVFIATTNDMTNVDYALIDRPSRFDSVYKIDLPVAEIRRKLIDKFFPEEDEETKKEAVKMTEGFSGAYFKELFICKNLNEEELLETIGKIKTQMINYKKFKDDNSSYLG